LSPFNLRAAFLDLSLNDLLYDLMRLAEELRFCYTLCAEALFFFEDEARYAGRSLKAR